METLTDEQINENPGLGMVLQKLSRPPKPDIETWCVVGEGVSDGLTVEMRSKPMSRPDAFDYMLRCELLAPKLRFKILRAK